jgi:hypothetical protein
LEDLVFDLGGKYEKASFYEKAIIMPIPQTPVLLKKYEFNHPVRSSGESLTGL